MDCVSYSVANIMQSYDNSEGVEVTEKGDFVYVDITKKFPSPGFILNLISVLKNEDECRIYFMVKPPEPDRVLPQIITYKTLTVRISKKGLGEPPYKFKAVEVQMA